MVDKNNDETNEEIVYDDSDRTESGDTNPQKKIEKLRKKLKKAEEEKREYLDGWQRAKADFINFKKRTEESKKELAKYSSENIILQILPIVDNFEQAFNDTEAWKSVDENWRKGIEMIYNQLLEILKDNNVEEIKSLGETFDPKIHECVETVEIEDEKDDDKILEVIQKGYRIDDKIIRHPRVKVGKGHN